MQADTVEAVTVDMISMHGFRWGMGSKSLTLDQVIGILLDQRRTKDWREAFKVIPRRKLVREDS